MNSLMIGAPKLDVPGISASQSSSNRQKEHNSNFRTQMPYRSLGSKASFKHECKHPALSLRNARKLARMKNDFDGLPDSERHRLHR